MFDEDISEPQKATPEPAKEPIAKPIKKKRKFKSKYRQIPDSWDYEFTQNAIKSVKDPTDRALLAIGYANGMRISECMALKFNDIQVTKRFFYIRQIVKKKGKRSPEALMSRAPPLSKQAEPWLFEIIQEYIKEKGKDPIQTDERPLFPFKRRTAQYRVEKYFKYNFHSLRKLRVRHLIRKWGYDELRLKAFFALSNQGIINWAHTYGNLNASMLEAHWENLTNKKMEQIEIKKEENNEVFE